MKPFNELEKDHLKMYRWQYVSSKDKRKINYCMWWLIPVIPALGRQGQEDGKF
jgi:hypothetical protein